VFGAGHAATAISAALGVAVGRDLKDEKFKVVAVLGDGALTSGLAYEGLNNAGAADRDIIVVLNDNEMSIAPNVGAMSKYLNSVQRNPLYNRLRSKIGEVADHLKDHGPGMLAVAAGMVRKWEESVKAFLTPGVLFEELGFRYFGPIDGHDLGALIDTLGAVRPMTGPRLVHVITQKGKGFPAGERGAGAAEKWHALPPGHDPATGNQLATAAGNPQYTKVFGEGLSALMQERDDVVCITAAMPSGTGTAAVAKAHPKRFFDVGIAEGHAVTFAAGLATRGVRPVVAIYSTFLQRAYDNIIHDVAIQHLPVVFCMDRAGLVGEDGETHMGLYDIAYMLAVPGMTVVAPKDGAEMLALLRTGLTYDAGPFAMRYPRAVLPAPAPSVSEVQPVPFGTWEVVRRVPGGAEDRHPCGGHDGGSGHRGGRVAGGRRPRCQCRQLPLPQAIRRAHARGGDVRAPQAARGGRGHRGEWIRRIHGVGRPAARSRRASRRARRARSDRLCSVARAAARVVRAGCRRNRRACSRP
jgi:1-deoxy-D-xylulose-5-phosphate synthase